MPREQFGFLALSLEELHAHLKDELARNPFINISPGDSSLPSRKTRRLRGTARSRRQDSPGRHAPRPRNFPFR